MVEAAGRGGGGAPPPGDQSSGPERATLPGRVLSSGPARKAAKWEGGAQQYPRPHPRRVFRLQKMGPTSKGQSFKFFSHCQ